ncbi:hypothetical protein GCM10011297_04550 [Bacterioplanes sanyensis]|uniref:putative solute-binding protein n=1 Tax=Bacterioplanes sanyensis TaxID=1249553 RepID=UPI0016722CD3|nr:putative solute-binding protein [Bacterioplanes sanyensis]GGY34589.1 hypothetical protein GCM10011297_04550 [Bacterioplanes sanyensis]
MNRLSLIAVLLVSLLPLHVSGLEANDQRRLQRLDSTIMNPNLPLAQRIRALKQRHADLLVDGKIHRRFCVWDPLGRGGPIYATVHEQTLRSLHYGLVLAVEAYQDEDALLAAFEQRQCDAALVRGNRVYEFSRFAATLEAIGGVPDRRHLQVLMQVLASPKLADKLSHNGYTLLGVAPLGESYFFASQSDLAQLNQLRQGPIAVVPNEPSLQAAAQYLGGQATVIPLAQLVDGFARQQLPAMLAPVAVYPVMSGQLRQPVHIFDVPVAQSTIQMIGHSERFPTGLAQMLREDFLFKFDSYMRRVDQERRAIPPASWKPVAEQVQAQLQRDWHQLRQRLLQQGLYDQEMLALQRKVRCRINPQSWECEANAVAAEQR